MTCGNAAEIAALTPCISSGAEKSLEIAPLSIVRVRFSCGDSSYLTKQTAFVDCMRAAIKRSLAGIEGVPSITSYTMTITIVTFSEREFRL